MTDAALRRRTLAAGVIALATPFVRADEATTDADGARLAQVIAGPQRTGANRGRDAARHPSRPCASSALSRP
jgi:predicted methyltransferase